MATGAAEITLRISSILLMVGAVYCSARRLFEWSRHHRYDNFCLHQMIAFTSIDVRLILPGLFMVSCGEGLHDVEQGGSQLTRRLLARNFKASNHRS
jgi:hypothetical protein